MNIPKKVVQGETQILVVAPTPTGTAQNGVAYPDPHPILGQFIKW